jgi:hypothetical protein
VVSGLFVSDLSHYGKRPHFWVEFWYEKLGWIPVDPALGDFAAANLPEGIIEGEPKTFYFGSLDNRHVAFSHGALPSENPSSNRGRKLPFALLGESDVLDPGMSVRWKDVNFLAIF